MTTRPSISPIEDADLGGITFRGQATFLTIWLERTVPGAMSPEATMTCWVAATGIVVLMLT
ncbi:MAG: hypothetical protein A2139_06340 [Desulfobacca sp. RBG_16_60_12]|nr:MAG: hypothetical protein A2139_06340 [Desulfobacca sp. RBG_16_60_12]